MIYKGIGPTQTPEQSKIQMALWAVCNPAPCLGGEQPSLPIADTGKSTDPCWIWEENDPSNFSSSRKLQSHTPDCVFRSDL